MKKYVFKPYNQIFPELFQKEKKRISHHIKGQIEHIGSTAVPGLGGKGIIDIAIAVDKKDMEEVSNQLQALGYQFRPKFSTPDRLYFIIYLPDPEEETRRYHIHLTYPENKEWEDFLNFRDGLRSNQKQMLEYAELKQKAASEAEGEGEKYRKMKEPIFKKSIVQIRQATSEDAAAIWAAEREIAKEPGYFCSQPSELTLESVLSCISTCQDGKGIYLIAELNDCLVGHAFLECLPIQSLRHVADLNIAVHLGWQNQGIGTKLLQEIIKRSKDSKFIRKIQLNVRATNAPAISLYKKMGFTEEGRLKKRVKVNDDYIDDIIMGLFLE